MRIALLSLVLLAALAAMSLAVSAAEGDLNLTSVGYSLSDSDGDDFNDQVTVNATVHNTDTLQLRRFALEVLLEHDETQIDLSTRDGQLDPDATQDLVVVVGTDGTSPIGTFNVTVLLHATDLTGDVEDGDEETVDLYPLGEYQVTVEANRTSAVTLENTSVDFSLTVGSDSNNPTGANISVETNLGWTYQLGAEGVDLAPGGWAEVGLTVQVPPNAPANQRETLTIEVVSTRNDTAFATVILSVTVAQQTFSVEMHLLITQVQVASGQTATTQGRVFNNGNNLDNVSLMADVPPGWTAVFEPPHLLLGRGTWMDFSLDLTPQAGLKGSGTISMNVTALSSGLSSESVAVLTVVFNSVELRMTGANVTLTPTLPAAGDRVTLQVSFRNTGSVTAENVLVVVISDGEELARTFVEDIPPSGIGVATLEWTAAPGTRLLRVVADPEDDLPESNENNNEVTFTMRVTSPDLSITSKDITITPDYPTEGTEATVTLTVGNLAEQRAPVFDVTLTVDGADLRTFTVDTGLPGGGNVTLEVNWTALPGRHEFTVSVDPMGQVTEGEVANNEASRSFTVNDRPVAGLVIHLTEVDDGDIVPMDASGSSDPDGRVRQYFFDYGDGTDSGWVFNSFINHTYGQTGTFQVRLYVKDEAGAQSAEPAVVEVTVRPVKDGNGDDTPALPVPVVLAALVCVAALSATLARRGRGRDG
jgi:uncharacterized membrane protein